MLLSSRINRYVELSSPQILTEKWRELSFDLASSHNVLQDFTAPEFGSGYVYRDSKSVGSATHNRFIYWRTTNDVIEFVELSTEVNLEDNQVRIRFVNSPIVNSVTVIEFPESIAIMIATVNSVHRIFLPHPKTTNMSVMCSLTSDVLFDPANYYLLGSHSNSSTNQPICAASWFDKSMLKCALSFPDSSIFIVQFGYQTHLITTNDIRQTGIIGRLWSKMPNLWAKGPDECENAIFASEPYFHGESDDVLLITLCRDCRIRIFSTTTRECLCSFNMIPQSSFHQSFAAHANPSTEIPILRILGSYIIVYLSENKPEFVFLRHSYSDSAHELKECVTLQAPDWDKLLDFGVSSRKIWALANMCETESTLCYMDLKCVFDRSGEADSSMIEGLWEFVNLTEVAEPSSSTNLVAEIFWKNRFSTATIQKALVGIAGPSIPKKNNMIALEELAMTRIVNDNQDTAWRRFYEYCIQNHLNANKCLGLVLSEDESLISIVKRSNPTFVCPWLVDADIISLEGPYRGIEFSKSSRLLIEPLNTIHNRLLSSNTALNESKILENPHEEFVLISELAEVMPDLLHVSNFNAALTLAGIEHICNELDLSIESKKFHEQILNDYRTKVQSEHSPLGSTTGIIVTFELFRRLVRARMLLARDTLLYISFLRRSYKTDTNVSSFCDEAYTLGLVKSLLDSLRSYATLVWIADCPIRNNPTQLNVDVIGSVAKHFQYFKRPNQISLHNTTILDLVLNQNLLMSFLSKGGANFHWPIDQMTSIDQALSDSYYTTTTVMNLCKLLWPQSEYMCLEEFLFTQQLDDHLTRYIELTQDWVDHGVPDRHFISASNYMLQNRANQAVDIFNRLWSNIDSNNLIARFLELDDDRAQGRLVINPGLINRYYGKLLNLFQVYNNRQCLVTLINHCMSLLQEGSDKEQLQLLNSMRAKLFQYYLELEDPDEAYHTMVLTTDPSLRINCLRKFIVSHCEREQWTNLLSYPYIDIKQDFIDILREKAYSLDISALDSKDYYKTTYYDLLFASYVMDDDFRNAAEVMYRYSERLAQELPGITSIRKQADCLLVSLNSLRAVEDKKERFLDIEGPSAMCNGRASLLKRSHDCETNSSKGIAGDEQIDSGDATTIGCKELEKRYALTRARLMLLEKDQTANAIALSPLKPEETINQLVASSLFSTAMDLALLFQASIDYILEGLAAKYILVLKLPSVDMAVYQEIERDLADIFSNSYSNIDTYNYVANSTSPLADRLWRLIDYYLNTYDGVNHRYRCSENTAVTTNLMQTVATKLLSAGYDVPASLKRLYMLRNTSELLRLMIKYDELVEAAQLATEMIDKIIEPASCITMTSSIGKAERSPVYLPTHLILLLVQYLEEDATDTSRLHVSHALKDRLDRFRTSCQVTSDSTITTN